MKIAVGKATIGSIRGLPPIRRTLFHRAIVRMSFDTILAARPTIEVQGPLRESTSSHYEITQIRLLSVEPPEAPSSDGASAFCKRGTDHTRVAPSVVPEREFVQAKGQIPSADVVVRAHDATLQKAPEVVIFNTTALEKLVVKYFLIAFMRGV
jgi:hypothetical protein